MNNATLSSLEALERLIKGNERFSKGLRSIDAFVSTLKLQELAEKGQSPFAIILTCSDSRVPAEIVFDQGIGDLFVIRVAGNVLAPSLLASIEFAALNFKTPLCLVMGHTKCGAIKAAIDCHYNGTDGLTESLKELVERIEPATQSAIKASSEDCTYDELLHAATLKNIRQTARQITEKSPLLARLIEENKFLVASALCDIASGKVEFDKIKSFEAAQREDLSAFKRASKVSLGKV